MKLRYFAWVRTRIGTASEEIDLPRDVTKVSELVAWLSARGPGYQKAFAIPNLVRVAINQEFVAADATLQKNDEVAFFPPVTGG